MIIFEVHFLQKTKFVYPALESQQKNKGTCVCVWSKLCKYWCSENYSRYISKGDFKSEGTGKNLRLQHRYPKSLSWAENFKKFIVLGGKFSAHNSDLEYLCWRCKNSAVSSDLKPPLFSSYYDFCCVSTLVEFKAFQTFNVVFSLSNFAHTIHLV